MAASSPSTKIIEKCFLSPEFKDAMHAGGEGLQFYYRAPWSTFFGPQWEGPEFLRKPRGFFGRHGKFEEVCTSLASKHTIRETSR